METGSRLYLCWCSLSLVHDIHHNVPADHEDDIYHYADHKEEHDYGGDNKAKK